MSEGQPGTETYMFGHSERVVRFLEERTAKSHASFFTPHLTAGMRVLDCGSGPGNMTMDFAAIIAPGEVTGIDVEPGQVGMAQDKAARRGVSNVRFQQADVYRLPFDDRTFDAAFSHTVMCHLNDPVAALTEIHRVMKPGGVLGVRDIDWTSLTYAAKHSEHIARAQSLFGELINRNGGDQYIGPKLLGQFRRAGFRNTKVTAEFEVFAALERSLSLAEFLASYYSLPQIGRMVTDYKLATSEELEAMIESLPEWGRNPDAVAVIPFFEAIGVA